MTNKEIEDALGRHEYVIEKLIEKIAALETANAIQNIVNKVTSKNDKKDSPDSSDLMV